MEHVVHFDRVKEYPNFISSELADNIIFYLNTNDGDDDNWGSVCFTPYWEKIGGDKNKKPVITPGITENTISDLKDKIQALLESQYGKLDLQVMKGHKHYRGAFTKPSAYYNVAAILHLNDNYSGGEMILPQHDISIKPNAYSLYVFEEGKDALYGVDRVTSDTRYSITSTWTFDGVDFRTFQWKDELR